jgi:hypothetical protein
MALPRAPWLRWLSRLLLTVGILAAVIYAVGGPQAFRRGSQWMRAFLEPPTPAQMERARVRDSVAQAAGPAAQLPTGAAMHGEKPPSVALMAGVIVGVLGGSVLLALATGRRRSRQSGEARRPAERG